MYRFVGSLADAASKIGIRAVLSNEVALPQYQLDSVRDNQESFDQHNGRENGRIQVWMGHEWMCTSDLELMAEVGKMKKCDRCQRRKDHACQVRQALIRF